MSLAIGLALAFLAELAALLGAGLLGGLWLSGPPRVLAGLAAAGLLALAWGRWAAPRARRRLAGPALLLLKLAAFTLGALGFALSGRPLAGAALLLAAVASLVLTRGHDPVGPGRAGR